MPDNKESYLKDFKWIVTSGITCGLDHPIEWAINAVRTPGMSLTKDYYIRMSKSVPRFLVEMYQLMNMADPTGKDDIIRWCDDHYPEDHLCRGFFSHFDFDNLIDGENGP